MNPAVKGNTTPDNDAYLWICVACYSQDRILPLPRASLDTSAVVVRTQLETELVSKDYTSPVRHDSYRSRWCIGMRSKRHNGQRERKFHFRGHLPRTMLDSCVRATRLLIDNDESGDVTAALTITLSFCTAVVLRSAAKLFEHLR